MMTGAHPFVFLIGRCEEHAIAMLGNIKAELMNNDGLLADWPEATYAIRALENQSRRCIGQLHHGRPTHIVWRDDRIGLPDIPGSRAAAAIVRVAGLTGNLRGAIYTRPDGQRVRPSLVILDDPQTDQSARSLSQCATRESILAGAVLGLAGPSKKISGIMPCTVIRRNDMADSILNRDKHPEWNGERTKLVYSFPTNEKLWATYAEMRADSFRQGGKGEEATEFYRQKRDAMDAGARVAWEQRFNPDEISAVQNAMNLKFRDEAAFFAEYQNEPLEEKFLGAELLRPEQIAARVNRLKRGQIPPDATHLTLFIDVQGSLLFYVVAAWTDEFTGYVIDYGAYPDQRRQYFTLANARTTLASVHKGAGLEGTLFAGLEALTEQLVNREWQRDGGTVMRIDRGLIDANWGGSRDVVYQFCRQSAHAGILLPSHGRFVGASSIPFAQYQPRPGERAGFNWRLVNTVGKQAIRHVIYDTNFWKSFAQSRLATAIGDRGALTLFGDKPDRHRLFADHLAAEYRIRTEGRGRTVDEWKLRPERPDNHWLDCLVGCAVAASMQGAAVAGGGPSVAIDRKRKSFAEMQRRRRQWGHSQSA
jgi:hypothetical protein